MNRYGNKYIFQRGQKTVKSVKQKTKQSLFMFCFHCTEVNTYNKRIFQNTCENEVALQRSQAMKNDITLL